MKQTAVLNISRPIGCLVALTFLMLASLSPARSAESFPGTKSNFNGAALYSFPIGLDSVQVLVPENPAPGRPWVLASQLYAMNSAPVTYMTRTELELVKRGFHVVSLPLGNTFGAPNAISKYDGLYREMTDKYGLAEKTALLGLSREGLAIARWAAANPGKVTCLYMDKAVCDFKSWPGGKLGVGKGSPSDWESLIKLYGFKSEAEAMTWPWNPIDLAPKLAAAKVAILYLAGENDEAVPFAENGGRMQSEYKRLGGVFELIMHPGERHHPHGSPDPKPVVDFIERNAQRQTGSKPSASSKWQAVPGHILTPWAKDVNPANPLAEYPRPELVRQDWTSLNGLWDYAIEPMDWPKPEKFDGKILVPYPVESALSGVKKPVWKDERLWYRRMFKAPKLTAGKRLLLNFGAVDWESKVFINGKPVGVHRGGYDSFTFDITDHIKPGAENELVVAVFDATGGGQANGKQNYNKFNKAGGIAYTCSSGIWQTVWLETVNGENHVTGLTLTPDVDASCLEVTVMTSAPMPDQTIEVFVLEGKREIARGKGRSGAKFNLPIPKAHLWTPEDPYLYDLKVKAGGDEVGSYFGMRKIALGKDERGFTTMLLNGKPVFQSGPLDQGFWPDGLYTAPTDQALRWDIAEMKRLGFNMVRKHIKVEPARWYYWCDKLGLLVWQDMPSGGGAKGRGQNQDAGPSEFAAQFEAELRSMIEQHRNHPSIIMWVVFNEGWGQYDTTRMTAWVKKLDPSRIVNSASGWNDYKTGDISDQHSYPGPGCNPAEPGRASVLGEFGGLGLAVPKHTWVENAWGYRGVTGEHSLTRNYVGLWREVAKLREKGLCAAVYTQLTDVESEANGIYTYDRKHLKVDAKQVADAHRGFFATPPVLESIIATSNEQPASWRYTTEQPATNWTAVAFDAATWRIGAAGFGSADFTNAPVRTIWESENLWLHRTVVLPPGKLNFPSLKLFHGQEVQIFINGVLAAQLSGRSSGYDEFDIKPAAVKTLKPGLNTIAVHCRRGKQSSYIDLGLVQESAN